MKRRQTSALSLLLLLVVLCALACGGGRQPAPQNDLPPLSADNLRRDINGRYVRTPSADGKSGPINWVFDPFEPKEIEVLDQEIEGESATFLVNMKTYTQPRSSKPHSLSGQLRLHYRLRSGLVLREWEINEVENVSFTYTNEPPPPSAETKKGEGDEGEDSRGADAKRDANGSNSNAKPDANRNSPARP